MIEGPRTIFILNAIREAGELGIAGEALILLTDRKFDYASRGRSSALRVNETIRKARIQKKVRIADGVIFWIGSEVEKEEEEEK